LESLLAKLVLVSSAPARRLARRVRADDIGDLPNYALVWRTDDLSTLAAAFLRHATGD
jgi:hypothetical protein